MQSQLWSPLLTLLTAAALALVHIHAGRLTTLHRTPRSRWLSAGGGASVAYVFVHLLPELSASQEALANASDGGPLQRHAYLVALAGLVAFYGLERLAASSRPSPAHPTSPASFWVHISLFALYNCLIGYLLREQLQEGGTSGLLLFAMAMALHMLVNDYGLREHHKQAYIHVGRWLLALAILLGWLVSALTALSPVVLAVLLALLAGAIILNVLKEELPPERESRFGAFALGAGLYTALLLLL